MENKEKTIKENLVYDGKIVKLYVDDVIINNHTAKREVIKHPGGVCILGFIDNKVILEKQYRYPYKEYVYELPAGKLEINEDPYNAALREFNEETGFKASSLIDLGKMYPSCGYSSEIIYLYLAKDLTKSTTNLDEDEFIDLKLFTREEIILMIENGTIKDAKTICLIYKYLLWKEKSK